MAPDLRQFIRFCFVGGVGLAINLFITHVGVVIFGVWYFWAYLFGVLTGWTSTFILNALFTFPEHRHESYGKKYTLFIATYAIIFALNASMVYVLTSLMAIHYLVSITTSALTTTSLSFSFSKRFIYKD